MLISANSNAQAHSPSTTKLATSAEADQVTGLASITVTPDDKPATGLDLHSASQAGSRLALSAFETPASVEIITSKTMLARGQTSINEAIAADAVGINFIGTHFNGNSAMSSRGFTGNASMTRLYDGVRLYPGSNTLTFPFDTWTTERIEILHGPASVLYGEGGIGGAINVVPKKPLFDSRRNEVQASIGNFGQYGLAGGSAGPINDRLAYSIDISGRDSQGWMDDGKAQSLAISGALALRVTPDWKLTLSHDYGHNKPSRYSGTPTIDGGIDDAIRKKNYGVLDAELKFKDHFTQLHSEWAPSSRFTLNTRLYYITSKRDWKNADSYTWLPATQQIRRSSYAIIGQEMTQYGGTLDAAFKSELWGTSHETVVGFDANSINFKRAVFFPSARFEILDPYQPDRGNFGPGNANPVLDSDTKQYSLFADHRVQITDRLSFLAGLRYDRPEVKVLNPSTGSRFSATLDSVNWRIGTVFEVNPSLALYAQYSKASDAFGSIISLAESQKDLRLPRGVQYEAGLKTSLFDGRMQATIAAYHIKKKDLLAADPVNPRLSHQIGEQTSSGLEASIGIDLGHGVQINANGTILRARYTNYMQAGGDFSGNQPANVPKVMANLWANWQFAPTWSWYGGINYIGSAYANDANTTKRPAYTLVNTGLSWQPTSRTTVTLHAQNLFDKVYATQAINADWWYLGTPRSLSLTLHQAF